LPIINKFIDIRDFTLRIEAITKLKICKDVGMTYKNRLLKNFNLASKAASSSKVSRGEMETVIANMMTDPRYLRQSSSLINEALQKGFDVLQLANGDIVTTGTKTVVYQYTWDDEKGKLVKAKSESSTKKSKRGAMGDEDEDDHDNDVDAEGESEEV
jgi:hypothetical protein